MKVALLLCTYNRPEYLKECLWSLSKADLSRIDEILIVDDASTDKETIALLSTNSPIRPIPLCFTKSKNSGIKQSLLYGYEDLFKRNDIVINIDSDVIVRPDFASKLLDNYRVTLLTGFNSITKNADGSDRHKIVEEEKDYYWKKSVGGINFVCDKFVYEHSIKIALQMPGNWDHNACIINKGAMCLKESVIQHIGFNSSMNHTEQPDIADDFYYHDLPQVTLLGIDSDKKRLDKAKDICTKWIRFGNVVTINPDIRSKVQYSEFVIKKAWEYVTTTHCLIFQHDGYVNNFKAWDNDWLQYDYIGAPWWYNDAHSVGNGGFSLRSKRLMDIAANDKFITELHPEDHHICRTYRPYLEKKYGIKFAPVEVAEKFSFEGYRQPTKVLGEQFGVHGPNPRKQITPVRRDRYVVNQYQGLGDILFLVPLVRALMSEGNAVLWPVADHYMNIAKHFPDIDMRPKSTVNVPYDSRFIANTIHGRLLPYRFSSELMGRDLTKCMQSKYEIYGHNWRMWRELVWKRDYAKEQELKEYLNLPKKYMLINRNFGEVARGGMANIPVTGVEMRILDGFSLIDWMGVIEYASEIHTANTSIMYLLELMQLTMPVYVYKRNTWGEVAFEHTSELWTNKAFKFIV